MEFWLSLHFRVQRRWSPALRTQLGAFFDNFLKKQMVRVYTDVELQIDPRHGSSWRCDESLRPHRGRWKGNKGSSTQLWCFFGECWGFVFFLSLFDLICRYRLQRILHIFRKGWNNARGWEEALCKGFDAGQILHAPPNLTLLSTYWKHGWNKGRD